MYDMQKDKSKVLDRNNEIKRLRDSGMTLKAIGDTVGLTRETIRGICNKLKRLEDRSQMSHGEDVIDPLFHIHGWEGLYARLVRELSRAGIETKDDCVPLLADELPILGGKFVIVNGIRITLNDINKIRAWLGAKPIAPFNDIRPAEIRPAEIKRAKHLLEKCGYTVIPPNDLPQDAILEEKPCISLTLHELQRIDAECGFDNHRFLGDKYLEWARMALVEGMRPSHIGELHCVTPQAINVAIRRAKQGAVELGILKQTDLDPIPNPEREAAREAARVRRQAAEDGIWTR